MSYPKIGSYRQPKKTSGRKCIVCDKAPAGLLDIEIDWYRGNDLTVACCGSRECRQAILKHAAIGSQPSTEQHHKEIPNA